MFVSNQAIPCPTCAEQGKENKIHFETSRLLLGEQFTCSECQSQIGLAPESRPKVEEAMDEVDRFKHQHSTSSS